MEDTRYIAHPSLQATFKHSDGDYPINNLRFRDISNRGCAFECGQPPVRGTQGILRLCLKGNDTEVNAIVTRVWERGFALIFPATDNSKYFASLKRDPENNFKERQKGLANYELTSLDNEVRQLKDCQLRLFTACFTISVSLISLLLFLQGRHKYSSEIIALIAIAPAGVSIIYTILSLQKALSLNRLTSFILILKQRLIHNNLQSKYSGWANILNNYYFCHSMDCQKDLQERCFRQADNKAEEKQKPLGLGVMFVNFYKNYHLFATIIYICYTAIFLTSLSLSCFFLFNGITIREMPLLVYATGFVILIVIFLGGFTVFFGRLVNRGKHCFIKYYYLWEIMLDKCEAFHPNRVDPKFRP